MTESSISGYEIFHGFLSGYRNIMNHRDHINKINVFPVPDGDTGNNMIHTFRSIVDNLECRRSASWVLEGIAYYSLNGARGNSGIIISQYLNGLARAAANRQTITVREFGTMLLDAVSDAYQAMDQPREGTILTVLQTWAGTVNRAGAVGESLTSMLTRGYDAARKALKHTPDQLSVLKDNKVVDAGAWGFVSFIEGIQRLLRDGPVPISLRRKLLGAPEPELTPSHVKSPDAYRDLEYRYCTEVLVESSEEDLEAVKAQLRALGDSLIVSRGAGRFRIHIHSNHPESVVNLGRSYGRVLQQSAEDMLRQEQMIHQRTGRVAVLTDSIADIPRELLDQYQIHVLNHKLLWDEDEYLDRLTISPVSFYRIQNERSSFPGTTVPERGRVDSLLAMLMENCDQLIVLPVAKALSGTWQQLSLAAEPYNRSEKRIEVVDTCLNSAAQGLLVLEIAKAAESGENLDKLVRRVEELKNRVRIFVSVRTFKFMVKGGRVSPLKGLAAKLLNLKPIVSLDESGRGIAFDKAFSYRGLIRKISFLIDEINRNPGIVDYAVVHADDINRAREFAALAESLIGKPPAYITEISPVIGMHSGKGAVAIGLIEKLPE
ncbi:MAG: DegV family protein [Spirochaetaceae bacterium]|nr:DegV family protein [Spirochaetaceae bacterium]